MRDVSKTQITTAGDSRSVNARSSSYSDRKSHPICRSPLLDLGRYICDAFASSEDPPGLESLVQDSVESDFRAARYLGAGIVRQSAAIAFFRAFDTIAGCALVGCICGYGLPSHAGSRAQDTHVGASGNGGRDTDGVAASSGRDTDGGTAGNGGRIDSDTTGSSIQEVDGGGDDGVAQDKDESDTKPRRAKSLRRQRSRSQ